MWTNNYLPEKSDWYICMVGTHRIPMRYNKPNKFWVELGGKTHSAKEGKVVWLDDSKVSIPT